MKRNEELLGIAKLLGEENEKKLKDGITNILLERIREDLDDINIYLMDLEAMLDSIRKDIEREAKEKIKNMYMGKLDELFGEMFSGKQHDIEKKVEVKEVETTNTDPYACSNCKSYKY